MQQQFTFSFRFNIPAAITIALEISFKFPLPANIIYTLIVQVQR